MFTKNNAKKLSVFLKNHNIESNIKEKNQLNRVRAKDSADNILRLFDDHNITYSKESSQQYNITGNIHLKENIFKVNINGHSTLMITNPKGNATRKSLTPKSLGLSGRTFTCPVVMKNQIIEGLSNLNEDDDIIIGCRNIIDSIDKTDSLRIGEKLRKNKSVITSDFGEIASAYHRLVNNKTVITFPDEGNYANVDFFDNETPVSAKGSNGGSKFSICKNKSVENCIILLEDSNINNMIKSWFNRDLLSMLNFAAEDCPPLKWWKDKLVTFTEESIKSYSLSITKNQFEQDIISSQKNSIYNAVGIPNWASYDSINLSNITNSQKYPLVFTLLTIWCKTYKLYNYEKFNSLALEITKINSNIEYDYFDYDSKSNVLLFSTIETTKYSEWDIDYWGNVRNPINNYPGLIGSK